MNQKATRKGRKHGPGQRPVQAHAPDRGTTAQVPGLGYNYGSSGVPTANLRQFAKLYRPLPAGM